MHNLAVESGISMSAVARDLIREALELREDVAIGAFAEKRMKSFEPDSALSHEETWS